jgi:AmmeMemoRadiSam system protein B/AmmeMemoRadiSam system protein A
MGRLSLFSFYYRCCLAVLVAGLLVGSIYGVIQLSKVSAMDVNVMDCKLAGTWYAADPKTLQSELQGYIDTAEVTGRQDIIALISPHAGYTYSGACAAKGVRLADRMYRRIVVIGPSHRFPMQNRFSVPQVDAFRSPLGTIPLDRPFIEALLERPYFESVPQAFHAENSIEMQLPLLQQRYSDFQLVPIAAGQCDWESIQAAGAALRALVDEDTLVVASGDFTHYGPNFGYIPFTNDVPANLKKLDMGAWEQIEQRNGSAFLNYIEKTGATICGRTSIAVLLTMLGAETRALLVDYRTSGQMTGDFANSVSYVSAAFAGSWGQEPIKLSDPDRQTLLSLARKTVSYALREGREPKPEDLGISIPDAAQAERAAFVTLHRGQQLRGCIGEIFPSQALFQSIIKNAINAALHDPRFPAVTAKELDLLHIEISALTPPRPVASWRDIRLGIDGTVLRRGSQSAVFLPQVAPEQGWDLETTLTYLAQKAGLGPDDWREETRFLTFQAEVFGETR